MSPKLSPTHMTLSLSLSPRPCGEGDISSVSHATRGVGGRCHERDTQRSGKLGSENSAESMGSKKGQTQRAWKGGRQKGGRSLTFFGGSFFGSLYFARWSLFGCHVSAGANLGGNFGPKRNSYPPPAKFPHRHPPGFPPPLFLGTPPLPGIFMREATHHVVCVCWRTRQQVARAC